MCERLNFTIFFSHGCHFSKMSNNCNRSTEVDVYSKFEVVYEPDSKLASLNV